jgi:hypothetical protein
LTLDGRVHRFGLPHAALSPSNEVSSHGRWQGFGHHFRIAGTLNGKVKIVKLNVDENPQTAAKYGIQSIPTLMIFKNGQMASRQIGAAPKQKLEQWITTAV